MRSGQAFLAIFGLALGVGGAAGLMLLPSIFEPLLRALLMGVGEFLHIYARYDPSQRLFYAGFLAFLGMLWFGLMAYAFIRQPAKDRAIDAYLTRHGELDDARVATMSATDDPLN